MKHIILFVLILSSAIALSQNQIKVCKNKAGHIISDETITYLQVGDHNKIIAEVVPEHSNMVRVKAVEEFEGESSLTMVSANQVYSFFVQYDDSDKISWQLEDFHSIKTTGTGIGTIPEYLLREFSYQVLSKSKKTIRKQKQKKNGMILRLINIYLKNDALFFELEVSNQTNMGYEVENFHWWIADKKQYKATNVQEYPIDPEYQHYNIKYIPAKTKIREVFVLPKLTIPDKRILKIEMLEKALGNTGRKLSLEIQNKDILEARTF